MIRYLVLLLVALSSYASIAQNIVTLNGYVKDNQNGEELIGVTVYVPDLNIGTVTNAYGFYALSLPKGTYDIQYSFVGFTTQKIRINMDKDQTRKIELINEPTLMSEVVVSESAADENIQSHQMSRNVIDVVQLKKLPALFGEADVLKSVQSMPGVIQAGEGTSAYFVRGGSADQNLILIDEAPIYDPSHLFGLFSVFNADVIKNSELYRGGIPARFGGRLSSILEVHTKDGNNKNFAASGGIGTMASRLTLEGPIQKENSSFIISGRRSYVDLFQKISKEENTVSFYDLNAKLSWKSNDKNRFYLAFYAGRDKFDISKDAGFDWGNKTGTFRWNHLFNERLFSNTTILTNSFDYKLHIKDPVQGFIWKSNLRELSIKNDLAYYINNKHELSFGYHVTGRRFMPGDINPTVAGSIYKPVELQNLNALDHALYSSHQIRLGEKILMDYGLRLSIFQNLGKGDVPIYAHKNDIDITRIDTIHFKAWENIKTYINLEPRLSVRYKLTPEQSLKFSYHRMVQNTHLISAGTVPIPFNTWNPSGYYLKPQIADQVAVGYFRNTNDNMYEFSVETYYKDMQQVTDFVDNAETFFNPDLSQEIRQGEAWAYGAELLAVKNKGQLTGMIAYTWSKAERKVPGVNLGNVFAANYDRRNVLNIQAAYDLNKKWTFGGTFTYSTGRPITLPTGKFEYFTYRPDVITERNGYRLPAFHRLDLSATYNPGKNETRKWKSSWVFSVYNAYNRKNPFTIYTRTTQDEDGKILYDGNRKEARLIYLFPILPSITYNFKF